MDEQTTSEQSEPTTTTRRASGAQRRQRLRVVSPLAPQSPVARGRVRGLALNELRRLTFGSAYEEV